MWLRVKVIGAAAICIAIPVLIGIAAVTVTAQISLRHSAETDLLAATRSANAILEDRLAQDLAHLKAFAVLPVMQDVLIGDEGGEIARVLAGMRDAYRDFATLTVTDARGAIVSTTAKAERGANLSADEGFRTAASGRPFQSPYGFRTASAPETIWFTLPLIAHYDRQTVIGTLTGVLDFKTVAKAVAARSALGSDGRALVIEGRDDGRIAFSSRIDAMLLRGLQDIRGERGLSEFVWNDETFFAVTSASIGKGLLRDPGFTVRGIAPGSAALATASNLSQTFGVVGGLGVLIAIALAWRWSTPLMDLGRAMDRLARGDTLSPVPTISARQAFAPMARAIEMFRQTRIVRDRLAARERELERAKDDAQAATLAKAEHLASLSRELRTQLNTIIGLSELINREVLDTARRGEHANYAKDIGRAGVQLLAVINDLFDLSEAEAGRSVLDESDADLAEVVRESVAMMGDAAQKAQIDLSSEGCDAPFWARVDTHKIKQILFNLISNAVKFTSEDGRVQVRLSVSCDGSPTIVVQDNGIGMPMNLTPVALTPFTPSSDATPHGRHGAGLGLPLVRRLVELHQGSIEIESEVGKGTSVTVALPASRLLAPVETQERLIA